MSAGRPTDYRPEYVEQARKLCLLGATDIQIADFIGIAESTLYLWKHTHPEFSEALKIGKESADNNVVRSLYRKAVGYEYESEKIFCTKDGDIIRADIRVIVPPSDVACIFWLKNRDKDNWRDKPAGEESTDRLDEIVAAAKSGPMPRGSVNE